MRCDPTSSSSTAAAERALAANPQALVDAIADRLVGGPISTTLQHASAEHGRARARERIGAARRRGALPDRERTRTSAAALAREQEPVWISFNRRRFLQCAAAGGLAYAFGRTPQAVSAAAFSSRRAFADYKALVCVFLFGGNDSFNMVVPRSAAEYGVYATSRQNLAIAQTSLLPINSLVPDPNGALLRLASLDARSRDAVRAGRGVRDRRERRPADRADDARRSIRRKAVRLPPQLFSHNDQQDQWHALKGAGDARSPAGAGASPMCSPRPVRQCRSTSRSQSTSRSPGRRCSRPGVASIPYTMGPTGPVPFFGLEGTDAYTLARRAAFETHPARQPSDRVRACVLASVQQRASARCGKNQRCARERAQPECRTVRDGVSRNAARTAAEDRGGADRRARRACR